MKDKIQEDIKTAMKARSQDVVTTLRGLLSEIKKIEIDTRKDLTDEQCIAVVQKEIKKRRDSTEYAKKAERADLIEKDEAELKLLQTYLGEQLSEDQLREIISNLVESGADSIGKVMSSLNQDYKGQFEGKIASQIVKENLG